jgi:cell division protein FtsN
MKRARQHGGGILQRLGLILAAVVILTLTFTLGVLVGRQWGGRAGVAPATTAETAKKAVASGTRRGLTEAEADRPRGIQDKLTFYQTLTAPLGPTGQSSRARAEDKTRAQASPAPAAPAPAAASTPAAPSLAGVPSATPGASASGWSVQVGAFRSRQQADDVQKRLTDAGFPAVLTTVALDDGQSRYRVRVGGPRSRDEAEQLAQQVRARLPLTTLVTAN